MHALRSIVLGVVVAVAFALSSGGAVFAQSGQMVSGSRSATDYEGSPVVTYAIINAWPNKYVGLKPA
jgi:hypothetical protein